VGSAGDAIESHRYRFNWNAPIVLSPFDTKTVYFGAQVIFRTANYGQSWDIISPDLSNNEKQKQVTSGGPIVVDNTAAEFHSTIISIAPSPKDRNVIWAGTDDGTIQVTRDGGTTWTNTVRNIRDLPPSVDLDHRRLAARRRHGLVAASHWQTDYAPYAYMTTDYGATWRRIAATCPRGWVHVVRQDPKNPAPAVFGTEFGVFASWDRGGRWHSLRNGLSAAPVRDLLVHPRDNDLIIATHGRGLYVLDDVTPLQQLTTAMSATAPTLFDVPAATRFVMWSSDANLGQKHYAGENPPYGAVISYFLRTPPRDSVRLTVRDGQGTEVRTLSAPGATGVNRVAWDRAAPPLPHRARPNWSIRNSPRAARLPRRRGPVRRAGDYTVTARIDGTVHTTPPASRSIRGDVTLADLVAARCRRRPRKDHVRGEPDHRSHQRPAAAADRPAGQPASQRAGREGGARRGRRGDRGPADARRAVAASGARPWLSTVSPPARGGAVALQGRSRAR
jgi:photosystem II stability/assembly factor-like uncharacterized protein